MVGLSCDGANGCAVGQKGRTGRTHGTNSLILVFEIEEDEGLGQDLVIAKGFDAKITGFLALGAGQYCE